MATNLGVYYPSPEIDAKFIKILDMFKHLSPAIHERLQNPNKGLFGPKKASTQNKFGYYNGDEYDQIQLLKEWYMTINILLNGEYDDRGEDPGDYKSYVIDQVKDKIRDFKGIAKISYNIIRLLKRLVDTQYNNALQNNIKLNRHTLYIINALYFLMANFNPLESRGNSPRIQSLALNTTTDGKKYNIEQLNRDVVNYINMMKNPITTLSKENQTIRSMPLPPSGNTRSNLQKIENRLAALKTKGGKRRKYHMTRKRSTHKKRTYKRKH